MKARVLKFHIWIPHENIGGALEVIEHYPRGKQMAGASYFPISTQNAFMENL